MQAYIFADRGIGLFACPVCCQIPDDSMDFLIDYLEKKGEIKRVKKGR